MIENNYTSSDDFGVPLINDFNSFDDISHKNRKIYLVLPTPEMKGNVPKIMAKEILLGNNDIDLSIEYNVYYNRNKLIIDVMNNLEKNNKNVKVLDPIPYLCNEGKCMSLHNKRPIYYDGDHMSEYGNKLLVPMFKNVI